MLRRVLVFGLLGPLALIGGCASGLPGGPNASDPPAATSASPPAGQAKGDKPPQTRQVTLSVSGMT
jgi:hypothetical protein